MALQERMNTVTTTRQLCTFLLDDLLFGIEVMNVQEVIRYQEMTAVPLATAVVRGLINLRGQIVTAIDMRARLGLPDPQTQRAAVALAAALYRTGQADAAERLLKDYLTDATRRREAGGGRDAPPTLVRNALAGLWEQADRLDEAIALRKKILRDSLDRHGPDHPATQQAAEVLKAAMHERQNREHAGGGERDALTDTAAP